MRIHSIVISILLSLPPTAVLYGGEEGGAPKNELAFGLGGLTSISRSTTQERLDLGAGVGLQVNYGRRIINGRNVALYGEVNFLASPLREVSSNLASATRDVASLYVTPGIRVKLFPSSRISPYLASGWGLGLYEQSTTQLDGRSNPASRELVHGAFDFGGGVDVHVWRFVALRGEARDFYTGTPGYNAAAIAGGQHNVVIGGAFVLRWH
jgi:hypothetical protein